MPRIGAGTIRKKEALNDNEYQFDGVCSELEQSERRTCGVCASIGSEIPSPGILTNQIQRKAGVSNPVSSCSYEAGPEI